MILASIVLMCLTMIVDMTAGSVLLYDQYYIKEQTTSKYGSLYSQLLKLGATLYSICTFVNIRLWINHWLKIEMQVD